MLSIKINFSWCFRCSFIDSWYGVSQTFRVASSVHCFFHTISYTSSDINFHTWVRRWSTVSWPLSCPWNIPAHQMSRSFYLFREPLDFEQSGLGLVERHLRSDRHQRRNNIPHGRWSWCLHWFKHQFGWSRSQANNEDILFQIRQSRSIRPLLTIKFSHTW